MKIENKQNEYNQLYQDDKTHLTTISNQKMILNEIKERLSNI
jgi:hypothetical protein